jgi:Zn-dependent M28 family amino/carboxypeptidase
MFQPFEARSRKTQLLLSSQNALAVVPGSGALAQEWVVVGAHYDHIGLREQPDGTMGINNGADDNASGTALVLEMARVFQAHVASGGISTPDRRSVLFAAFGAEEEGLLGSCHYALESPAVPISLTRAMMNFDMVGRLRDGVLQVFGFESSDAWPNMVVNANRPELTLFDPPPCQACTDFACFRDRGVPYIWLFTGTHGQYHTPADDVELINFPGLMEVGEVALRVLSRLAVMPEGPSSLVGGNLLGF